MIKTNAMRLLDRFGAQYEVHDYSKSNAISGKEVAGFLGQDPRHVFKTLVTKGKKGYYVFMLPVERELDLKKAASAVDEKSVEMIPQKELFPLTGYVHGGCSPLAMKKQYPVVIDIEAKNPNTIIFSAGKIGYQIEIKLSELVKALPFQIESISSFT